MLLTNWEKMEKSVCNTMFLDNYFTRTFGIKFEKREVLNANGKALNAIISTIGWVAITAAGSAVASYGAAYATGTAVSFAITYGNVSGGVVSFLGVLYLSASLSSPSKELQLEEAFEAFESQIKTTHSLLIPAHFKGIRKASWSLSKISSEDPVNMRSLQGKIETLNSFIKTKKEILGEKLGCQEIEIEKLMITIPLSRRASWGQTLTLPVRILSVVARLLGVLPFYGFRSLFFKNANLDPKTITKGKTPILLVHGSGACQRQWDVFRRWIENDRTGHVFSLNLNNNAFIDDSKDINTYASDRLIPKLTAMKAQYKKAGYTMDKVILVGHSMGGLVSGAYATQYEERIGVQVQALVAMSSPWHGSPLADIFIGRDSLPASAFHTDNEETAALREAVVDKFHEGMGLYTFNSSLDEMVPVSSSSLPIPPQNQIYHNNHNHHTSAVGVKLASDIGREWVSKHTTVLQKSSA